MAKKLPAILFYTGDWLKDPSVRACGLAARGLWFDTLCLMHESPERGRLVHRGGKAVTHTQLARMVGAPLGEVEELLSELEATGVFYRDGDAIVSRRMVADEEAREAKAAAGRKGAANRWSDGKPMADPMAEGKQIGSRSDGKAEAALEDEDEDVNAYPSYLLWREIAQVVEAIPANRRRSLNRIQQAIAQAIIRLEAGDYNRQEATAFLVERVTAYCQSSECKGEFHRLVLTWFNDEGYLEPEEAWANRHGDKSKEGWEAIDAE